MRTKTWPLRTLVALSVLVGIYEGVLYWHGFEATEHLRFLWQFVFLVLLVLWVDNDSKDHPEIYRPYEFGYFVLHFWLPYLPYYFWRTRGALGLLALVGLLVLFYMGYLVRLAIYVVR